MNATAYSVRRHTYLDSVFLMRVAKALEERPGVTSVAALMATPANKQMLRDAGFSGAEVDQAAPDDLVVGVTAATSELAQIALGGLDALLASDLSFEIRHSVRTWDQAVGELPEANLAVISIPGEYAASEIEHALNRGLHVFCFSSNVALADEIRLKNLAQSRGLLLMGPDCGTAIIASTGLGFSNAVRRGPIGIVGGAGTGIQAVSCLVHAAGSGVSHAIGTGSRDASDEVGGVSTLAALHALSEDTRTEVIVLVSKARGATTLSKLNEFAATCTKPVVTCFLGGSVACSALTLEEAASRALRFLSGGTAQNGGRSPEPPRIEGRAIGLFAGGSFLLEAQGILQRAAVPKDRYQLVDMGSEELTRGRAHPMIDSRLRAERIAQAGDDAAIGALLLDFVLGRGAAEDPAGDLVPSINEARSRAARTGRDLLVVASVCGTDDDPQDRAAQEAKLRGAGVMLLPTSTRAAAFLAGALR
jgi:FdrA protein